MSLVWDVVCFCFCFLSLCMSLSLSLSLASLSDQRHQTTLDKAKPQHRTTPNNTKQHHTTAYRETMAQLKADDWITPYLTRVVIADIQLYNPATNYHVGVRAGIEIPHTGNAKCYMF